MTSKRRVEVFSAGCPVCDGTVQLVKGLACPGCEVIVYDMHESRAQEKSREYGIASLPSVVIDGKLADCCNRGKVDADTLRAAGVGVPL